MKDIDCATNCDHKIGDVIFTKVACPKCKGKGTYFDITFSNAGDFNFLESSQRLVQDIKKVLIEQLGSNIEDSSWGSELFNVSSIQDPTLTKARVTASVINALKYLYTLQKAEGFTHPEVLSSEKIAQLGDLKLLSDDTDPRYLEIALSVIAESAGYAKVNIPL